MNNMQIWLTRFGRTALLQTACAAELHPFVIWLLIATQLIAVSADGTKATGRFALKIDQNQSRSGKNDPGFLKTLQQMVRPDKTGGRLQQRELVQYQTRRVLDFGSGRER